MNEMKPKFHILINHYNRNLYRGEENIIDQSY